MRVVLLALLFCSSALTGSTQLLNGFTATGFWGEQELTIKDSSKKTIICINAPLHFNKSGITRLVFYALPNGNSIEWTKGKKAQPGNDWHFDIQHIGAQTRYVRALDKKNNYVVIYLMAEQKSWPAWKRSAVNPEHLIKQLVDSISGVFSIYQPEIVLNGHSGGGSFIFGFIDAANEIPANITRIAFLDSDYGYNDTLHLQKIVRWLSRNNKNNLLVLAYNDSLIIYNGKPLVSPTGGTWYRSRLMLRNLSAYFPFSVSADTSLTTCSALKGRINIILKENPQGLIYHTEQVARNGYILSLLSGTRFNKKKYFTYFGKRVYEQYIPE